MYYVKLLTESLAQDGVLATARKGWQHLHRKCVQYLDIGFDLRHGVDTCRPMSIHDLDVDPTLKPDLVGYEATPVHVVRRLLRELPVAADGYTFIDYGSGKGRALVLASELPFRRVIGVELSPSLHQLALLNISRWRNRSARCVEIVSLNQNATDFVLPDEPLVIFFFTPFLEPVLQQVISRIQTWMSGHTHGLYLLYFGSRPELLDHFYSLGLTHRVLYTARSWFSTGRYTGHLFHR